MNFLQRRRARFLVKRGQPFDGSTSAIPLGEGQELLPRLQELPGFDNETFIRAMGVSEEAISTLWRR